MNGPKPEPTPTKEERPNDKSEVKAGGTPKDPCKERVHWEDPRHPIWRFLNLIILVIVLYIFSWDNAQNFDQTEIKMITEVMIIMFGVEGVKYLLGKGEEKRIEEQRREGK